MFKVYQVDIDDEIRQYLFDFTREQLENVIRKHYEIIDYDVISDDTEQLYTYSIKNKVMPFSNVVHEQLVSNPPKIMSIESVISDIEALWAYCVGFNDVENSDWVYTFRKIQPSKVAVDEKENQKIPLLGVIRSLFNTKSKKLELLKGETINLEKQIDCVYYNNTFYIIKKGNFEQIVGLHEEFKVEATKVIRKLRKTSMITGLDIIMKEIESNPTIHKQLVRISTLGNYKTIDIKQVQRVSKKHGLKLNIKNGKIVINEKEDIREVLKLLADYYKTGDVTGKSYGTFSGKEIKLDSST
jgi:hypothetical protein